MSSRGAAMSSRAVQEKDVVKETDADVVKGRWLEPWAAARSSRAAAMSHSSSDSSYPSEADAGRARSSFVVFGHVKEYPADKVLDVILVRAHDEEAVRRVAEREKEKRKSDRMSIHRPTAYINIS